MPFSWKQGTEWGWGWGIPTPILTVHITSTQPWLPSGSPTPNHSSTLQTQITHHRWPTPSCCWWRATPPWLVSTANGSGLVRACPQPTAQQFFFLLFGKGEAQETR